MVGDGSQLGYKTVPVSHSAAETGLRQGINETIEAIHFEFTVKSGEKYRVNRAE